MFMVSQTLHYLLSQGCIHELKIRYGPTSLSPVTDGEPMWSALPEWGTMAKFIHVKVGIAPWRRESDGAI